MYVYTPAMAGAASTVFMARLLACYENRQIYSRHFQNTIPQPQRTVADVS